MLKYRMLNLVFMVSVLAGCASEKLIIPTQGYKVARAQTSLEIPPDLINTSDTAIRQRVDADPTEVLPTLQGIDIKSDGKERWLQIESSANDVWAQLLEYTAKAGLPVLVENKLDGILETDWIGDASSDTTFKARLRATAGDLFGRPPLNDKYTFWLEKLNAQSTALHVRHRQLKQTVAEPNSAEKFIQTAWAESPGDGFKALQQVRKLRAYFGGLDIETDNTADVVLVQTSPVHILLKEPPQIANGRVMSAIGTSSYLFEEKNTKKNLLIIREPKHKGGFAARFKQRKRYGILIEPIIDGQKTRIMVVTKRGGILDREEALPVLYSLAGELRK